MPPTDEADLSSRRPMKRRRAVATVLNGLVVAVLFAAGVHYLVSTQLMPYHEEVLDVAFSELTPRCQLLMLTLMKGTGMAALLTAVSLAVLLAVPFRRREPWSRWAILIVGFTALVPMLIGAVRLRIETGAGSPWWANAAMLGILSLAFWLTKDFNEIEVS